MDRRTFIGATGVGVGVTGCLDAGRTDPGGGNETTDGSETPESDGTATGSDDGRAGTADSNDTAVRTDGSGEADPESDESAETGDGTSDSNRDMTFDACSRATVTGTFEDGDVALASTGFYDDGLYGNTMLEDGVVFGDDVDAPFSGTIVFEIADGSRVRERDSEIVVEIPDYGSDGTVITSLTTRRTDYERVTPTHENPHASDCLSDLEADSADATLEGG